MCLLSVVRSTTGTPGENLKRKIMVQIHFLQLSPQHWPESLAFTLTSKPLLLFSAPSGEIHNWYTRWKSEEKNHGSNSLPSTLSSTLTRISSFYPNIKALVTILCTLPVTSCTAERSFSGLKCIRTLLRSSMSNERLSSLTLLHMHQDIPIDIEEVIDEFSRHHPRWIQLSDHSIAVSSLCCFIFSY